MQQRRCRLVAGRPHHLPPTQDFRPSVTNEGPMWGYHLDDMNLALGNLVLDVAYEEASYR